jgi:hypothetical protein
MAADEIHLMDITATEAPFLVGLKGRNISLIRKASGMLIHIRDNAVYTTKLRPASKPDLASRMVLSACCGGILRWFVTQAATQNGYPIDQVAALEAIAQTHHCELKLLRARCGHMCLMLIPTGDSREHIAEARKALLEVLPSPKA